MNQALSDMFVLDLSDGVAGAYCSKLLADLGADVIKVEPPTGDSLRRMGPFPESGADPELSGLHLALNANKRSVMLDLASPGDRGRLGSLIRRAAIVIESFTPEQRFALGITCEEIQSLNPAAIVTSITPFGRSGAYSAWKGGEIVEWAMGGWMYFSGDPGREPLLVPGHQAALQAGMHAAIGSLAAVHHARETGRGQVVEVSHFESLLVSHPWLTVSWSHDGQVTKRGPSTLIRCRDGGHVFFLGAFRSIEFFVLIERPDLMDKPEYATAAGRMERAPELTALLREWCATQTAADVQRRAQELRIAGTCAVNVEEMLANAQMAARQWFQTRDHPLAGRLTYPGFPFVLSATPCRVTRPAPRLGEHTAGVLAEAEVAVSAPAPRLDVTRGEPSLPLSGINVLELTANMAGPLTVRHLADLGADVIKVEYAKKPATRSGHWPGGTKTKYHYNRSGYFNKFNRNKRDICLDLSHPDGRAAFLKLVKWADILVENNSVRVMPNLGLDYGILAKVNPRLIMLSMSGFGATGPHRDYLAYGSNIELSCGLVSVTGYGPGEVANTGSFYGDPIAGNHGAVAVLAALLHQRRTGCGQFIDLALTESAAVCFTEAIMQFTMNGKVPQPMGTRSRHDAPQGVYRCFGDDEWLALTVRDAAEWRALCSVIGRDDLGTRPDLQEADGRRAAHDAIDAAITAWTVKQDKKHAARRLQSEGVPAAPVLANWELVTDPSLHERGFFLTVNHPETGVLPYPGFPWRLSRTPAQLRRPAPLFAEHNREVLMDIAGLDESELAGLYERNVTADEPEYIS